MRDVQSVDKLVLVCNGRVAVPLSNERHRSFGVSYGACGDIQAPPLDLRKGTRCRAIPPIGD